jgi:hypothetical protein
MINPLTGTITIIDFDLLSRTGSFGITGAYNNPPEVMNGRLTIMKQINYVNYSYTCFTHLHELYPSKYVFRASLMEAVNMNRAFKERVGTSQYLGSLMATFDSYGLACTLLILFHEVYPGSIRSSKEELKSMLASIITNQGRPYTEEQMNACTDAMYAMIHSVLLPLASIHQEGRKKVSEVLPTVSSIEATIPSSPSIS